MRGACAGEGQREAAAPHPPTGGIVCIERPRVALVVVLVLIGGQRAVGSEQQRHRGGWARERARHGEHTVARRRPSTHNHRVGHRAKLVEKRFQVELLKALARGRRNDPVPVLERLKAAPKGGRGEGGVREGVREDKVRGRDRRRAPERPHSVV